MLLFLTLLKYYSIRFSFFELDTFVECILVSYQEGERHHHPKEGGRKQHHPHVFSTRDWPLHVLLVRIVFSAVDPWMLLTVLPEGDERDVSKPSFGMSEWRSSWSWPSVVFSPHGSSRRPGPGRRVTRWRRSRCRTG